MTTDAIRKTFQVRWADCDANQHMRHSAYNDFAAHVRMCVFDEGGFGLARFQELDIGPVLLREDTRYLRELTMQEWITVDYRLSALSSSAARWFVSHTIYKESGEEAARIHVEGAWMSMRARRLTVPVSPLAHFMNTLPRTPEFKTL